MITEPFPGHLRSIEPKLTYALDTISKRLISVDEVERGVKCNCICPKCQKPLVAKKGIKNQHHFAHQQDYNCTGYYMTTLHLLAEQIIEENKRVMFPKYKEIPAQSVSFKDIEKELRNDRKDLQPDIVGITPDGERWAIEIYYTHAIDEAKKEKIKNSEISCLEIDISQQVLNEELLTKFLLESTENRKWINNPNYDKEIRYRQEIEDWKYLKKYKLIFISDIMDLDLLFSCLDENMVLVMKDNKKFLIVEYAKAPNNNIIILHRDYKKSKTFTPFHLTIIYHIGYSICYDHIGDYTSCREAEARFQDITCR